MDLIKDSKIVEIKDNPLTKLYDQNIQKAKLNDIDKDIFNFIDSALSVISDQSTEYSVRYETIAALQGVLVKPLVREMLRSLPNDSKIKAIEKTSKILSDMLKTLESKKKSELSDEIDPTSPKFQLVFEWFIESIHQTMNEMGLDNLVINNFFQEFSTKLQGWEERVQKNLKGVSVKALEKQNLQNPFIQEFKENINKDK